MSELRYSPNFIGIGSIPRVRSTATIREAFHVLSRQEMPAFVLTENDQPVAYVKAGSFAEAVQAQAQNKAWDSVVFEEVRSITRNQPEVKVRLGRTSAAEDVKTLQGSDGVFIVEEEGRDIGLFLNDKALSQTVNTPPPVFLCEVGHENADPDDGYCYQCPKKIKEVKVK
ncbi:MAG: hypothetical protein M1461_01485 [Nitrospirae bacterium]|nr:hypothetical protein [Nitrospirota bacterium]